MEIPSLSILTSFFSRTGAATAPQARPAPPPAAQPQPATADRVTIRSRRTPEVAAQERAHQAVIQRLAARDRAVRAHEQAHLAQAGGLAKGGPKYQFQRGPDGRLYAVGGSVELDATPIPGNPRATIQKARQIRAAALAPSRPSAQDRAAAAAAGRMEARARLELESPSNGPATPTSGRTGSGSAQDSPLSRHIDFFA